MSNLGQGYLLGMPASGRHSHKGHRGKYLSLHTYCEFQPGFCSQSRAQKFDFDKI